MDKKYTAPKPTRAVNGESVEDKKLAEKSAASSYQRSLFVSMALTMSWQLAIIIIVPIVGGYELDKRLHTLPILTSIGFIVAMAGMFVVLKRTVAVADQKAKTGDQHK